MFKNKTALVTGASRGIGRAIALALAEEGAAIVINYVNNRSLAEEVVREIEESGGKALAVCADVSNFEEAGALVGKAKELFGSVDILVNNAGVTKDGLIMRMTEEDFDRVLEVNLKGAFNCCRHVVPLMVKQRSGRIINITSIVGLVGNAGQANYAASKAGLIGLTKSLAKEIGSRGITVNAVAPGFIETDMTSGLNEKMKEDAKENIALKKLGTPVDIANAVCFLASEKAAYITGQVISVDGGMSF
ncbi:MAG: 3-oxoacyl-[acyl-carrier-protein] reductase [Peptococcaceae bacterium]|jgi:3-oxoacyl-[acyl-carrier protein] reductase|nr:3-oxoacyl-[acyl-carrier-protein] reductase [Peptococcaceae bacterium]